VKTVAATDAVRKFSQVLAWVESGEVVRIQKQGRTVATVNPERGGMKGCDVAGLFGGWKPTAADRTAAAEIQTHLKAARKREANELAARLGRAD
jgi:antitoxin (DNA-binding transcriptional repressor) of toxin-antitoxin stability system